MNDPILRYSLMVITGAFLGVIFFGGLWMTIQAMPRSKHPALLFFGSLLTRSAILLGGIWFFAAGDAMSIIACLLGFIGVRLVATHSLTIHDTGRHERTSGKTQSS